MHSCRHFVSRGFWPSFLATATAVGFVLLVATGCSASDSEISITTGAEAPVAASDGVHYSDPANPAVEASNGQGAAAGSNSSPPLPTAEPFDPSVPGAIPGFFPTLEMALMEAAPLWTAAGVQTYSMRYEVTDIERLGENMVNGWVQVADGSVTDVRHFVDGVEQPPTAAPVDVGYSIDSLYARIEVAVAQGLSGSGLYNANGQLVAFGFREGDGASPLLFDINVLDVVEGFGEPPAMIAPRQSSDSDLPSGDVELLVPTATPEPTVAPVQTNSQDYVDD